MGYSNIDNYSSIYNTTLSPPTQSLFYDPVEDTYRTCSTSGGIFPTIPTKNFMGSLYSKVS